MTATLWSPSEARIRTSNLRAFADGVARDESRELPDFSALHHWSVQHPDRFWSAVWDSCGVVGTRGQRTLSTEGRELWQTDFFPDATLNFSENLLRRRDASPAIIFAAEGGVRTTLTWAELHALVSRLQQALRASGVGPGDRVAAWLPNAPEAYALLLASASLGAVFSSCSPDFGVDGVVDRFGQIEPTVLVAVDGYVYGGRAFDCLERLQMIRERLPTARCVPVLAMGGTPPDVSGIANAVTWDDWLAPHQAAPVEFAALPFDQPLAVLYSSGTTGLPKCIVHRAGGVLLKHLVEHRLHCDVKPGDRVFYFTTTGWMMWNWLASALASEATLVVYDGSPVERDGMVLWDLADEAGITLFGTSAKFLDSCKKLGLAPAVSHDLGTVRTITSTGSPLAAESFEYVYEQVKPDVHLASISGGTDLCGCLVAGDPTSPVLAGEIQCPGLGMDIAILGGDGRRLETGTGGELACGNPFPSMPLGFWDDPGDRRYRAAYYERFPGFWHQGDFAEWTEAGGIVIRGRSDATLNPGGVRIGTAEIYRQVEALDEVTESLVIGQPWDRDVRVVLFVVLRAGVVLDDRLQESIRARIRQGASPRHVPDRIIAVRDLPRTRSGKLTELAVRDVVEGRAVANVEALANPEALEQFRGLGELRT